MQKHAIYFNGVQSCVLLLVVVVGIIVIGKTCIMHSMYIFFHDFVNMKQSMPIQSNSIERCFSHHWLSYIYIIYIIHNSCFSLFILHNNSFDNQGSEINNDIFLRFDILSFTNVLPGDGRSIFQNVASLNIPAHDVINVLYYELSSCHVISYLKTSHKYQY